jgi:hypothetical protein
MSGGLIDLRETISLSRLQKLSELICSGIGYVLAIAQIQLVCAQVWHKCKMARLTLSGTE